MKKIGILYGMENSFPHELISRINNSMKGKIVKAELLKIGAVKMDEILKYNVIFDRASAEVPYYHSILKQAALHGIKVVNNPYWNSTNDNFFISSLAEKIKIKTPKTVILPSKEHPTGTTSESMRNLIYPLNWQEVFEYTGFPAIIKPNIYSESQSAYKVYNEQEFFAAYDFTGSKVMILQESIDFDSYYRCYCIGKNKVRIIGYDPKKPLHLRFQKSKIELNEKLQKELIKISLKICSSLGFEFNAVELGIKNNTIFAVDMYNPAPSIEKSFMAEEDFNWLVDTTVNYLINLAEAGKYVPSDYPWSEFLMGPKSQPKVPFKRGRRKKSDIENTTVEE